MAVRDKSLQIEIIHKRQEQVLSLVKSYIIMIALSKKTDVWSVKYFLPATLNFMYAAACVLSATQLKVSSDIICIQ